MKIRTALLATACAFALSACGGDDASPTADPAATPSTAPAETSPAQTPPATTDAAPGDMAPADWQTAYEKLMLDLARVSQEIRKKSDR